MTLEPPSPQLQAWIDSDRPTPPVDEAMAQRLRARVFATVGIGVAAAVSAASAPAAAAPASTGSVVGALAGMTKPVVLAVGLVVGAGVGGGVGAWWGTQRSAARLDARPHEQMAVAVAVAPIEQVEPVEPVEPVAPAQHAPVEAKPVAVERSTARAVPAVPARVEAQEVPSGSLDPDLALLQQARAALARGAVLEARKALVTHRARFDRTAHLETREALDVLVLWASSSPAANDATERFFKTWPDSAFQAAIRRAAEASTSR